MSISAARSGTVRSKAALFHKNVLYIGRNSGGVGVLNVWEAMSDERTARRRFQRRNGHISIKMTDLSTVPATRELFKT